MKIMKYMMQVLLAGGLLTSCIEDADVTAYLTEDQLGNVAQEDPDKAFSAAVAGMYSDMQQFVDTDMSHNYFGQKSFDYLTSLMGNDMIMTGRFAMSLYHYLLDYWQQNYTPTNNRWKEYYRVIANANNILMRGEPAIIACLRLAAASSPLVRPCGATFSPKGRRQREIHRPQYSSTISRSTNGSLIPPRSIVVSWPLPKIAIISPGWAWSRA